MLMCVTKCMIDCTKKNFGAELYNYQKHSIKHLIGHKRLLLDSTIGSEKSLAYQVNVALIGEITLIIVPLLALGSNHVHRCNRRFSKGINLDEVSKSSKEKISLMKILDDYL